MLSETKELAGILSDIIGSDEFRQKAFAHYSRDLVRAAFRGLIVREPEPEALASYSAGFSNPARLGDILSDIIGSDEFWEKLIAAHASNLVRAAYLALLGREPDQEGMASYVEQISGIKDFTAILSDIIRSEEFWNRLISARAPDLVKAAFIGLLRREPEPEAMDSYSRELSEKMDLSAILADIIGSNEFREKTTALPSKEVVREIYLSLLQREPDQAALEAYSARLRSPNDLAGILVEMVRSSEFAICYADAAKCPNPIETYDHPCLVFLHIQKTAGTSIQNHLGDYFPGHEFYREHADSLHAFSPSQLSRYNVFAGHFNYDSLSYIPRRTLSIITFVREPRSRLLSLYYFLRAHEPSHRYYGNIMELAGILSVEEFFEDVTSRPRARSDFWNNMCRAIMGHRKWQEWDSILTSQEGENTAKIIEARIRPEINKRLQEFIFIGIQEDFDRSVELLFCTLKLQPPAKVKTDHTLELLMENTPNFKRSMEKQPITRRCEAALDGLVQLDNIVYEESKKLYERRLAEFPQ